MIVGQFDMEQKSPNTVEPPIKAPPNSGQPLNNGQPL